MRPGFSYIGLIYLLMLYIPNIIWTKNKPEGYDNVVNNENKVLLVFERIGEVLMTVIALVFSDFNLREYNLWSTWLILSFICMVLYEISWIRYFKAQKSTCINFYASAFIINPNSKVHQKSGIHRIYRNLLILFF